MTKRQAKKVYRRWLRATPYDEQGRALPPYHSLMRYRRTTFHRARLIVGREEQRFMEHRGRRWYKWSPYHLIDSGPGG